MTDLTQCPRCLSREIVEVHGHYQCKCGLYVAECCQGECEQNLKIINSDPLDKLIENCEALIRKQKNIISDKYQIEKTGRTN